MAINGCTPPLPKHYAWTCDLCGKSIRDSGSVSWTDERDGTVNRIRCGDCPLWTVEEAEAMDRNDEAYVRGVRDYNAGRTVNPYPDGSEEREQWEAGWDAMEEEATGDMDDEFEDYDSDDDGD